MITHIKSGSQAARADEPLIMLIHRSRVLIRTVQLRERS